MKDKVDQVRDIVSDYCQNAPRLGGQRTISLLFYSALYHSTSTSTLLGSHLILY